MHPGQVANLLKSQLKEMREINAHSKLHVSKINKKTQIKAMEHVFELLE